jgi:Fic/DOC family N-terminal
MDIERFRNSPPGRLVRAGQLKAAYWAFVPHPLPPDLPPDAELMRASADADHTLGELAALGRTLSNPHMLIGPFMRREAVLSSSIEGTQTDVADLYTYEGGQSPLPGLADAPPPDEVREVANCVAALEYDLAQPELDRPARVHPERADYLPLGDEDEKVRYLAWLSLQEIDSAAVIATLRAFIAHGA